MVSFVSGSDVEEEEDEDVSLAAVYNDNLGKCKMLSMY